MEFSNNNYSQKDLAYLANTFTVSAVAALQVGGQREWIHFRELLLLIHPTGNVLLRFSQVKHYLQRIIEHLNENSEQLGAFNLITTLQKVFSDFNYSVKCNINYPSKSTDKELISAKVKSPLANKKSSEQNPLFHLDVDALERKLQPALLKLTDIHQHLPRVVSEIAKHESVWKNCLGLTLVAANTDIPCEIIRDVGVSANLIDTSLIQTTVTENSRKAPKSPKTGFEVVESLVRYHYVDTTQIWYLNFSKSIHYKPYDLVVVSKNKVASEHFVISVFGVLHVKPNGESELIPLGQWYREATLYKTITKIRFFKSYLIFKSFKLWKDNVKFAKFSKIRKQLKEIHLLEVPSMREAVIKINQLLCEMESISLFPFDRNCCYTLEDFTTSVNVLLLEAQKYTEKLYNNCQQIIFKVQNDCLEYLMYCEFQLEQKADNIKESMTVAKQRRNQQIHQLCVAKYITEKLPCFAQLVKLILHEFMIKFVSGNISEFVHDVMKVQSNERKGLFYAFLEFEAKTDNLIMSPEPIYLEKSLKKTVNKVISVLSEFCAPLILPTSTTTEKLSKEKNKPTKTMLTVKELQTLLNCSAKEANDHFNKPNSECTKATARSVSQKYGDDLLQMQKKDEIKDESLQSRMNGSKEIQDCYLVIHSLLKTAFTEVEDFKDNHKWISHIHEFVSSWDADVLDSWKGQSASRIEKQVQQIRTWIDQVNHVERSLETTNGLLFVDANGIQDLIIPALEAIFTELMDMTAQNCLLSSEELISKLNNLSKRLSTEASTLKEFTSFYVKLKKCKEEAVSLHNRVEYTNSIFEVVRHCYRQLNSNEEETEQKLHAAWDSFQYALQDANDKFDSLSPQMLESLDKTLLELEGEAQDITEKVTSGKFLDYQENPDYILPKIKNLHERFAAIKDELLKLAECKETVTEEPHDLTALESMHTRIIARHELWKYCEVSSYTIKEWLQTPFYKLQVKKVIEKVTKWKEGAAKLRKDIPANDEVLESWMDRIKDFGTDLPLLLELSSVPLKARHWKWLFAGLGQIYDQSYQYLVCDLVNMGLRNHSQLIVSICDGAAAEHALESHLKKLIRKWEDEEFKLMKHFENQNKLFKRETGLRKEKSKLTTASKNKYKGAASSTDMFILTGVNELQSQVEDNLVTLQSMLVSPNLAENTSTAETWSGHLHQLKEILDLWINCQQKWLYLGKIFSDDKMSKRFSNEQKEFEEVDLKYKEHMSSVLKDPKVLSVLEKKRGEKGYRDLQGENLRTLFFTLITKEEKIIKSLNSYLEGVRSSFPRLYFLSDNDMLELLASTRNPKHLVPFVKKCFPGIANLKFVLPQLQDNRVRTQLDAALNAHKLEVVSLFGKYGEEITLPGPIVPSQQTESWLKSIEQSMKSVIWTKMGQCVEERMLFTPCVKQLLKGIGIQQSKPESDNTLLRSTSARRRLPLDDSHKAFWYMVYPFQCVLAAEEVVWTSKISTAVSLRSSRKFTDIRAWVDGNIQQYSTVLQCSSTFLSERLLSRKAYLLIQSLLTRSLHHRDLTQGLDKPEMCDSSFEWLQCLKYKMDASHYKRGTVQDLQGNVALHQGATDSSLFGMLTVNQLGHSIPYGYEYHGPTTRMIITPMTDRCVLSLSTAFKMRYTGMVFGANQTGKTEMIHELSKILGAHLVTFSCSSTLPLSKVLHFVCGAIQSGSLICFENITRLPCTVLSVLGQHLDGIRHVLRSLERNKISQYEMRGYREAENLSNKGTTTKERRVTVMSLHTLSKNDPDDFDYGLPVKETRKRNKRERSNSVAEIINIKDPRAEAITARFEKIKEVKSEIKMKTGAFDLKDKESSRYKSLGYLGNVMFAGQLVKAHPLFGCFMTVRSNTFCHKDLPDNLRSTLRSVSMVLPEYRYIAEALLVTHGFKTHSALSKKIFAFKTILSDQFFGDSVYAIGLGRLKALISTAANGYKQLKLDSSENKNTEEIDKQWQLKEEKTEEYCIGQAIHTVIASSVNPLEYPNFIRLLKVSFPACRESLQENHKPDELLLTSVKEQLLADSLLNKQEFVDKVMQLHTTVHLNRSIILLGESGSGKTVCYQTLCRALCQFYSSWSQAVKKRRQQKNKETEKPEQNDTSFSQVNLSTLYHKAMSTEELFGGIKSETGDSSDGLLPKLLRSTVRLNELDSKSSSSNANSIQYWFVFDGQLDDGLTGKLESLLDGRNELCLTNGERIKPPDSVRFLFETTNLRYASPAIISLSAIVNFESNLLDWNCLFYSWKKSARNKFNISGTGINVVENMIGHIHEPLIEFLLKSRSGIQSPCLFPVTASNSNTHSILAEISSILQMLTSILDRFLSRESAEKAMRKDSMLSENDTITKSRSFFIGANTEARFISNAFTFSFVWATAGRLHETSYRQFDTFTRQLFATCSHSVIFPCSVFETIFDPSNGELARFQERSAEIPRSIPSQHYTVSSEIEKCFTVADLLVSSGSHILITGAPGVGKSSFVKNLLASKHKLHQISVSQGLTPKHFQQQIQNLVLENQNRHRANPLRPPPQMKGLGTNNSLFFIDDVSLAAVDDDVGNSQPTIEVLREMISEGGVYDRERKYFQHLPHLQIIAACVPPRHQDKADCDDTLSPRLSRRMNVINMITLSDESLQSVYTSVYKAWLEEFPAYSLTHIEPFAKALAYASVDIYSKVKKHLVTSPSCPHYIFSQHDLARISKGVFIYSPKSRVKVAISGKGPVNKGSIPVNESMPELAVSVGQSLADKSQSTSNVNQNNTLLNLEYTPAAISPLIRVIIRLWCHEVCRSFCDRIIDTAEKEWFSSALQKTVVLSFCGNVEEKPVLSQGPGIMSRDSSSLEKKGNENRVKFKDIESTKQSDYRGPLISFKHLLGDDGELTRISFSKHLFIYGSRGVDGVGDHEKGYVECLEEHLEEALRKSLNLINTSQDKRLDLILYRESLNQAVRISRILALSGGHALLVSLKGHGRANIVNLVARLANIKVMNVNSGALKCRKMFHSVVKDACFVAGLQGKPVVLFIPEGLKTEGWQDVSALLNEGTCPGLYTQEELNAIGNHLLPGGQVGQRRTENKTVAQERFLRRIRSNLHIVMCVWYGELSNIIRDFPTILSRSACVDIYKEWTTDILNEVAEKWLIEKGKNEFFYRVPWDLDKREKQLTAIYSMMSKIHLTSRATLDRDFRELGLEVFSPLKFVEFVDLFRTLCNTICDEKEEELSRLRRATGKVEEGEKYIEDVENRILEVTPLLEESRQELAKSEANVKLATTEYRESRDACDYQQKEIDQLELPLAKLNEEAHEQLGKLSPIYEAAMKALQSLDIHDVEEIRSYRDPPVGVKKVADTLCLMFNKPANWEEAKLMLIRDNFFQELLFYNKDEIPDSLYKKLKRYYDDPETSTESLMLISRAASSLSTWIRAIYDYCNTLRSLDPKKKELKEAERKLKKAKALLGEKRVRCNQLKSLLENEIELFKENMKKTRNLEKQIQTMNRNKNRANGLLGSMNLYIDHWKERTAILLKKIETAPGDSLLIAATVCYLGTFEQHIRDILIQNWLQTCRSGVDIGNKDVIRIPVDENFSIIDILSFDDEQIDWKKKGLPTDHTTILNSLITRTCCFAAKKCWPILVDPHDQAAGMVRCMEEGIVMPDTLTGSVSSTQQKRPARTLLSAILMDKFAVHCQSLSSRPNTKGNIFETTFHSDMLRDAKRFSIYSSLDDRDCDTATTPDTTDSAISPRRPKTAYSTFSAITNESVFLKKFYVQAGLKDEVETPSPSPVINLDEDVLLIIDVDSEDIDRKLKAAIAKGIPALVTHLERGIHSSLLASILGRSISVSDNGNLNLNHGKTKLDYHPNFRLYLSASVPMSFNKTNRFILPLHKSIVVNLAMSKDELTDYLVSLTISSERPELESQRRSLELDLFYLRQEKRQIQGRVLDMIVALPGKILDETSLPEIMAETKEQLNTTRERHDEGENYKKELEEKRVDYHQVASHASGLYYNVILEMAKLKPYYDVPLFFFIGLFKKMLKQGKRSKAESGSVTARAAELNANFTLELYKRICLNIFKEHTVLFPMLVVTEKLARDGKITKDLFRGFMRMIASLNEKANIEFDNEDDEDSERPKWLTTAIMHRLSYFAEFDEFKNIVESLHKQESQWKEYFDSSPNLICSCPSGFESFGSFQKAMLWVAVMPEKLLATIQDLVLCHLGPRFTTPVFHDLEDIYNVSEAATPLLIMLPDSDKIVAEDPLLTIEALGRCMKIQVVTISLGLEEQLTEAVRTIKDAVKNGYWVVLLNCHLERSWSTEFLRLIEEITSLEDPNSKHKDEGNRLRRGSGYKFRLWLIMQCSQQLRIPVALARKGLRVAWDETIRANKAVPVAACAHLSKVSKQTDTLIHQLSLLHYKAQSENHQDDTEEFQYLGTTSDLRFGIQLIADLSNGDNFGYEKLDNSAVESIFLCLIRDPLSANKHSDNDLQCETERNKVSLSCLSSNFIKQQDNGFKRRMMTQVDAGYFQNSVKILSQNSSDQDVISPNPQMNVALSTVLPELDSIYDSISGKSSYSTKSVYQFFHREINYLREVCWEFMVKIENSRNTEFVADESVNSLNSNSADSHGMDTESVKIIVRHLRRCSSALVSYIRPRSRQPFGYELSCIPHPRGLFASVLEDFCNEQLADIAGISWECQVLIENEDLLPPIKGIYLRDFHLENSSWDYNENLIHPDKAKITPISILHLTPCKKGKSTFKKIDKSYVVSCPLVVYKGNQRKETLTVHFQSFVEQKVVKNYGVCVAGKSSWL